MKFLTSKDPSKAATVTIIDPKGRIGIWDALRDHGFDTQKWHPDTRVAVTEAVRDLYEHAGMSDRFLGVSYNVARTMKPDETALPIENATLLALNYLEDIKPNRPRREMVKDGRQDGWNLSKQIAQTTVEHAYTPVDSTYYQPGNIFQGIPQPK